MPVARRIGFFTTLLLLWAFLAGAAARADLVWEPATGWRAEGGLVSPFLATEQGKNAKSLMDAARRAEDAGQNRKALKTYNRVIKKYGASVYAPEALFRTAGFYERGRKYTKAFRNLQRIVQEHPAYPRFTEVLGAQYRIADKLSKGARPLYWGFIPGFKQREKGVEFFEYIVINNYPDSFLTSDAYLKLAGAQASITQGPPYDQASTQLALTYFQDYLILYPGEADAAVANQGFNDSRTMLAESKMTMGDFYYKYRSNYKAAKVFYNEAITIYPESAVAERARRYLATIEKIESGEEPEGGPVRGGPRAKRFWVF